MATTALTELIGRRIWALRHRKTQMVISREAGYSSENMVAQLKAGRSLPAFSKVVPLARALEIEPAILLQRVLELKLDVADLTERGILLVAVTPNEKAILDRIRTLSHDGDPALDGKLEHALATAIGR